MQLKRVHASTPVQLKNFKIAENSQINQAMAAALDADESMIGDDDDDNVAQYTERDLELGEDDVEEFTRLQKQKKSYEIIGFNDFSAGEYDDDTPFFANEMAISQDTDDDYMDVVDYDMEVYKIFLFKKYNLIKLNPVKTTKLLWPLKKVP